MKEGEGDDENGLESWEVVMKDKVLDMKEMVGKSKELLSWLDDMTSAGDLPKAFDVIGALADVLSVRVSFILSHSLPLSRSNSSLPLSRSNPSSGAINAALILPSPLSHAQIPSSGAIKLEPSQSVSSFSAFTTSISLSCFYWVAAISELISLKLHRRV
ncbi:hypothetical protein BVRB_7g180420 [Beta vulgaris subsp. vulgaris]|uniref:Uncharacterized protein n=1 Tax=Beta vulgaris subsp. vulgaris TaxID=3555 RepID=A0A0J8E1D8_BETVV|nr:hypothetical protein BVRB_7g180420 [Beta vulgaris subsp. vulgaris]